MTRIAIARTTLLASAAWLAACGGSEPATGNTPGALRTSKGAITALGSITVNGVRFSTSGATVKIDDQPGTEADLKVGMVVKVKGHDDGVNGQATEVEFEDQVRGRVDDVAGNVIRIGEQEIEVEHATEFEDNVGRLGSIANGDRIRVSGVATSGGRVRASRVDKLTGSSADFEMKGFVSGLAMGPPVAFVLRVTPDASSGLMVTLGNGVALPAGVADGSFVEVRSPAAPAAGAITATAIELEDARLGGADDEAEVEGIVTSGDSASFMVAGQTVVTAASTRWENGVPGDLLPGVKVEAEGHLDSQSPPVLHADKVSFRANVRLQGASSDVVIPDAADPRTGSFKVLGLAVLTDSFTEWKDFSGNPQDLSTIGAGPVLVRGYRSRDGASVVAVRVERTDDTRLILQGPVTTKNAGAGTLVILGLTVATGAGTEFRDVSDSAMSQAAFFAAVTEGRTVVKARGRDAAALSGTTLTAEQVEIEGDR